MRPSIFLGFVLMLLCQSYAGAEDLIFFADDHYKVLGGPNLHASAINPVIEPGRNCVLRIALANDGRIEELIPISGNGSKEDIALEMDEELHSVDAQNINVSLIGDEHISVTSNPCHIDSLPSGSVAQAEFNVSADEAAGGWHDLQMHIDYEHQMDVSVFDGVASPLYLPGNASQILRVMVQEYDGPLRVLGVSSEISPGSTGIISAAVKNSGGSLLRNCTLRLMAVSPFHPSDEGCNLGDIGPGAVAVAKFPATVDGDAGLREYRLACEVLHKDGKAVIAFPLALKMGSGLGFGYGLGQSLGISHILLMLMIAAAIATFLVVRNRHTRLTRLRFTRVTRLTRPTKHTRHVRHAMYYTMYSRLSKQIRSLRRRRPRR